MKFSIRDLLWLTALAARARDVRLGSFHNGGLRTGAWFGRQTTDRLPQD